MSAVIILVIQTAYKYCNLKLTKNKQQKTTTINPLRKLNKSTFCYLKKRNCLFSLHESCMMAMVKKDPDGHGCYLSHQKFLADLYRGKFMDILFHLKTPFMMDGQAKALSRSGTGNTESETTSAKKRKRKANAALANEIPQSNLVNRMQFIIEQLKFTNQKVRF